MCPPGPPQAVIFDLDGTLVQTREASWRVFEKVSAAHGLGITTAEQFYELFSNNFFVSLHGLCRDDDHVRAVEEDFMRSLGADYKPLMIPGMADVVKALVPYATLAVLSSNSTEVIRRILRQNGLAYCFSHVFGGDVEPNKAKGIRRFLDDAAQGSGRLCQAFYDESAAERTVPANSTAIITDTVGDVEAALGAGIRAIGVAWGMHTEEQLIAAGAEFVAIWPQEILAYLFTGSSTDTECACTLVSDTKQRPRHESVTPRVQRRIAGAAALQTRVTTPEVATLSSGEGQLPRIPASPRRVPMQESEVAAPLATRLGIDRSNFAQEILRAVEVTMS
ncbi:HAD family hydrolase [Rhodococcus rhodochrous]|uniref:HAD family hydrolase n=1 Tax=Rhodococcus rhodochrous TaxID=1829 RepID=UPI001E2DDFB7|nr:HAD family hydrolase [Rhodococcus rhodochrous]MCB8914142.1 HAD family hydrolase [Rhodococcus rhodochrous]